jgi:hypothetical protein
LHERRGSQGQNQETSFLCHDLLSCNSRATGIIATSDPAPGSESQGRYTSLKTRTRDTEEAS